MSGAGFLISASVPEDSGRPPPLRGLRLEAEGLTARESGAEALETPAGPQQQPTTHLRFAAVEGVDGPLACGCAGCGGAIAETLALDGGLAAPGDVDPNYVRYVFATNTPIDQLIGGAAWDAETIYYQFPDSADLYDYEVHGVFTGFNPNQEATYEAAFAELDHLLDVNFVELAGDAAAAPDDAPLLRIGGFDAFDENAATGFAFSPDVRALGGDVWYRTDWAPNADPTQGEHSWFTAWHEVGHALGLKHPFAYGVTTPSDVDFGWAETIMSYSPYGGEHPGAATSTYAQSFMPLDIQALQHLYGKGTRSDGADTYTVTAAPGGDPAIQSEDGAGALYDARYSANALYMASWDSGGSDALTFAGVQFSSASAGVELYVAEDRLAGFLGEYDPDFNVLDHPDVAELPPPPAIRFLLDERSWIETVTGSAGGDLLHAGEAERAVNLRGGGGADTLLGGAGADTLNGGAGDDRFIFLEGGGSDVVEGFVVGGSGDRIQVVGYTSVASYQQVGADTLVRFSASDSLLLKGVSVSSLTSTDLTFGGSAPEGLAPPPPFDPAPRPFGVSGDFRANAITGGSLNDTLFGEGGDDTLSGLGGDDILNGGEGDDILVGGQGTDTLAGGAGVDTLSLADAAGGVGADLTLANTSGDLGPDRISGFENITGGAYADALKGNGGANRLLGGDEADLLDGRGGSDRLDGEAGDDTVLAGLGDDTLAGGAGLDTLSFAAAGGAVLVDLKLQQASGALGSDHLSGFERVLGGAGGDTISGDEAADTLLGGTGGDLLSGLGGADRLDGGEGADTVVGGKGVDTLVGGAGVDTLSYAGVDVAVSVNLALNAMTGQVGPDAIGGFENVIGGLAGDRLTGDGAANRLDGGDGDDTVFGGAGVDSLVGGAGFDTLSYAGATAAVTVNLKLQQASGGHGGDQLSGFERVLGGAAADLITGDGLANILAGGKGNDTLAGGDGNDSLLGGDGDDQLNGGSGVDTALYADVGANLFIDLDAGTAAGAGAGADSLQGVENLIAGRGDDRLAGDRFANRLEGGRGSDQIAGGAGADVLVGGRDGDRLTGGAGADRFVFLARSDSAKAARDRITDLAAGDILDLSAIDADSGAAGDQAFVLAAGFDGRSGLLVLTYSAKKDLTLIEADVDGDLEADMTILADGDHTAFTNFLL